MKQALKKCFVLICLLIFFHIINEKKKTHRNFKQFTACLISSIWLLLTNLNSIFMEFRLMVIKDSGYQHSKVGKNEKLFIFFQIISPNFNLYILNKINLKVYFDFTPVIK